LICSHRKAGIIMTIIYICEKYIWRFTFRKRLTFVCVTGRDVELVKDNMRKFVKMIRAALVCLVKR